MRSQSGLRCAMSSLGILAAACGPTPSPIEPSPTPQALATELPAATSPSPIPAPATQTVTPTAPIFTVAVIVDMQSEPVTRDQAFQVVTEANGFLSRLTSIGLVMTDFVEDGGGGATNDMASRYINGHAAALPNGLLIFSFGDEARAKLLGGYSFSVAGPTGYSNTFSSPIIGSGQVYVAVVHYGHKYAACGYGGAEVVQSASSLDGECRNQPGTACIQHNGYSMCSDSIGHLYASTPSYFTSSTIVHELLHPFAAGGDQDHYSTPECNLRMGYPPQFFDLQEAQYYNGLCPDVYDNFRASYQP